MTMSTKESKRRATGDEANIVYVAVPADDGGGGVAPAIFLPTAVPVEDPNPNEDASDEGEGVDPATTAAGADESLRRAGLILALGFVLATLIACLGSMDHGPRRRRHGGCRGYQHKHLEEVDDVGLRVPPKPRAGDGLGLQIETIVYEVYQEPQRAEAGFEIDDEEDDRERMDGWYAGNESHDGWHAAARSIADGVGGEG